MIRLANNLLKHKDKLIIIIFVLLLYKDVFSNRVLLSNLDPFPDSLHYIIPARSLALGGPFNLVREGREQVTSVPPLYSLVLVPFFIFNQDPRMFYFANFLLALTSFSFFYLILSKITKNAWFLSTGLFFYVTNYFIYWYPSLPMAENLFLSLFLAAVLILISKINLTNVFLIGLLSVGIYATKYAAIPITFSLVFLYTLKIYFNQINWSKRLKNLGFLFLSFSLAMVTLSLYEYYSKGFTILSSVFNFTKSSILVSTTTTSPQPNWFSLSYFSLNIPYYLKSLIGEEMRFLWDNTPLVPKYISFFGIAGLLMGLVSRGFRYISLVLISLVLVMVLFLSIFYSTDARYIYHAIPSLILGFVIFFTILFQIIKGKKAKLTLVIFVILIVALYLKLEGLRIKNQIALNLRHEETPWSYVSVKELNSYFNRPISGGNVVISAIPPYYIDLYSNGNYKLLPLSQAQEFRNSKELVWGAYDYGDLIKLYRGYLNKGYSLYVHNYGLGNEGYLHEDFKRIEENFRLDLVKKGCFDACNIYQLFLKE